MKSIAEVMTTLRTHMTDLFWKIAAEKEAIEIDGMPGYNPKAQFVGGKVINQCSWVLTECLLNTDRAAEGKSALHDIIRMVSVMPMETWGILNGIEGLWRLKKHHLLETLIDDDTMAQLRHSMDWRTFVDVAADYALIHKPTNYYGVAFGIARYRELLGWDEEGSSAILLEHLLNHIRTFSGSYGFMDETKGDGRFDRYSLLVPAELTILILNTGWQVPQLIRDMLSKSAHAFLKMANADGTGVAYGRSIGAYGETAAIQTLAAAALLGDILTEDETRIAYGYSACLIRTMTDFWYDEGMASINMWDKGRRTDEYRNKHRILGENLSLNMQVVDAIEQWQAAGYDFSVEPEGWIQQAAAGSRGTLLRFAKDEYDRCLALVRDGKHVWQLPLISGGKEYYDKDPYQAVPRENLLLEGVADESRCTLVPLLQLQDGTTLMPSGFASSVSMVEENDILLVSVDYATLCVKPQQAAEIATAAGSSATKPEQGIVSRNDYRLHTEFRFSQGSITRSDTFCANTQAVPVKCIALYFGFFSDDAKVSGSSIQFGKGPITAFNTEGYGSITLDSKPFPGRTQHTPHGANQTVGLCHRTLTEEESKAFTLSWQFCYK